MSGLVVWSWLLFHLLRFRPVSANCSIDFPQNGTTREPVPFKWTCDTGETGRWRLLAEKCVLHERGPLSSIFNPIVGWLCDPVDAAVGALVRADVQGSQREGSTSLWFTETGTYSIYSSRPSAATFGILQTTDTQHPTLNTPTPIPFLARRADAHLLTIVEVEARVIPVTPIPSPTETTETATEPTSPQPVPPPQSTSRAPQPTITNDLTAEGQPDAGRTSMLGGPVPSNDLGDPASTPILLLSSLLLTTEEITLVSGSSTRIQTTVVTLDALSRDQISQTPLSDFVTSRSVTRSDGEPEATGHVQSGTSGDDSSFTIASGLITGPDQPTSSSSRSSSGSSDSSSDGSSSPTTSTTRKQSAIIAASSLSAVLVVVVVVILVIRRVRRHGYSRIDNMHEIVRRSWKAERPLMRVEESARTPRRRTGPVPATASWFSDTTE